jgi:GAF domain-containing protein
VQDRTTVDQMLDILEKLEEIAHAFDGVAKAFALQAGREIRIIVESQKVSDDRAALVAKDIAQKIKEIIIREELIKGGNIPDLNAVTQMMSQLEAEVSIPLISKGQLIGMINLSHKFNKDIYSHEDIELLSTLANQTAVAIENARLYEDLKRSKSYIRRADRLASLGTLTAGLAHEIRNPLVAVKTLTQLLPERLDDEEFTDEVNKDICRLGSAKVGEDMVFAIER